MARFIISAFLGIGLCLFAVDVAEAGNRHERSSVCEDAGLIGAAFAACNVYCEALDCDGDDPNGSERSCQRALNRFRDLTDGSVPPCTVPEGVVCPCSAAWNQEGFFPANATFSECVVDTDGDVLEHWHVYVADEPAGTSGYATVDFADDENPEHPYFWFGCSTFREPFERGAPDSGAFDMSNFYSPESPEFDRMQNDLFAVCKADLMAVIEEMGLECEVTDLSSQ